VISGRVVIVGANLAGGTASGALGEEGFDGEIVLVGGEPHLPHERPPLKAAETFARPGSSYA
jgi:3-phenylpropionate/trans-cinnamate dioxygenase ferredoxin reductase component